MSPSGVFFMKKTFDLHTDCEVPIIVSGARSLGYVCMIMCMCRRYSGFQLVNIKCWLEPAIAHNQIMFCFDRIGNPVGYVTWAYLAPDSENRLLHDPKFLLNFSEWNEGGNTWIIDFCFPRGGVLSAAKMVKKHLSKLSIKQVFWARRDRSYKVCKVARCLI